MSGESKWESESENPRGGESWEGCESEGQGERREGLTPRGHSPGISAGPCSW